MEFRYPECLKTQADRHAYLILAHTNPGQLAVLLSMLDHRDNDLYLHLDARMEVDPGMLYGAVRESRLRLLEPRREVQWGQYSKVEVKLRILEAAVRRGPYRYYHLISGMDLPLQSQERIHRFFEAHAGKEFIHLEHGCHDYRYRYQYYYPFLKKRPRGRLDKAMIRLRASVQGLRGVDRTRAYPNIEFQKGSGWFSVTDAFARELLSREGWIYEAFHDTYCPDESVVQTVAWNSEFREAIFDAGDVGQRAVMRYIDWNRGHPYVFRKADFEELVDSGYLFGRKFDANVDGDIIEMLRHHVEKGEKRWKNQEY